MASPSNDGKPGTEDDPESEDSADSEGWDFEDLDPEDFVSEDLDIPSDDGGSSLVDADEGLSDIVEEEENGDEEAEIESYEESPQMSYADSEQIPEGSGGEFALGLTPVSASDLMEEIESGDADVVQYDEAPPDGHDNVFTDAPEEHFILEEDDDVIIHGAPPEDYQAFYSQYDDEEEQYESVGNLFNIPVSTSILDKRTLMGKVIALGNFQHAKRLTSKDNKEQAQNALKIANKVTKIPLGPIWHKVTQTFMVVFFLANIGSAIADIILSYNPLYFKVPALILGVIEQAGLGVLWIYYRKKRKTDPEYGQKTQQYIENGLHELLLYPIIIVSVVGFATDQLYNPGTEFFKIFQLCLLVVDMVNLMWAQGTRMFMIHRFMKDIHGLLASDEENASGAGLHSPGHILRRAYITTVGNTILMVYLVILLGIQEHTDNVDRGELYLMSWRSGVMVVSLIVLPIYSILLFLLTNSFWVLTIFMTINLRVSTDEEFQKKLREKYGHTVSDATNLAISKSSKTKKRLEGMNQMPNLKKVFFGLTTPWMIPLILLWQALTAMPLISLLYPNNVSEDGIAITSSGAYYISASMVYIGLTLIFNAHLLLLAIVLDVLIPLAILCFLFYPISVLVFFRRQVEVTPDSE